MKQTVEEFERAEDPSSDCTESQLYRDYCEISLISNLESVCGVGLHSCILESSWLACDKLRRGVEIITHSLLESIHSILDKGSTHICILLVDFCQAANTAQL